MILEISSKLCLSVHELQPLPFPKHLVNESLLCKFVLIISGFVSYKVYTINFTYQFQLRKQIYQKIKMR